LISACQEKCFGFCEKQKLGNLRKILKQLELVAEIVRVRGGKRLL
jgi:hypothetical protein